MVRGMGKLPGASNYFIGNDPARWQREVPNYTKVRYEQVYPGIDLVYYGNPKQLEYDFILAPGANPEAIRMDAQGADKLDLDVHGDLLLRLAGQQIRIQTPAVYQEADGKRQEVAGHFILRGEHQIGFQVGAYDSRRPLTIDPVLIYSSYLGGSGVENSPSLASTYSFYGAGVAVDGNGNAYLTGYTTSLNFPEVNPSQGNFPGTSEVFVTKIDPTGSTLLYSTFFGGSGDQDGLGIAVDSSGNAYVTGFTTASNFPTTPGAYRIAPYSGSGDAFVFKINAAGSTIGYSTYLGGNGYNVALGIAVDSGGNAYVAGYTSSTNFPTVNSFQGSLRSSSSSCASGGPCGNAFVTKFNANGSAPVYSTYLGGSVEDYAVGIAVGSAGNAYVTGATASTNFPLTSGAFDPRCGSDGNCNLSTAGGPYFESFIAELNVSGSGLVYSTYLGGSYEDDALGHCRGLDWKCLCRRRHLLAGFPDIGGFSEHFLWNPEGQLNRCGSFCRLCDENERSGHACDLFDVSGGVGRRFGDWHRPGLFRQRLRGGKHQLVRLPLGRSAHLILQRHDRRFCSQAGSFRLHALLLDLSRRQSPGRSRSA